MTPLTQSIQIRLRNGHTALSPGNQLEILWRWMVLKDMVKYFPVHSNAIIQNPQKYRWSTNR
jgi:hypothetical protein